MNRRPVGRVESVLLLLVFAVVPAVVAQFSAKPPTDRAIHVESFRYGKDPAVIRVNRGDRLTLTFSAREHSHSFFLEEFGFDAKVRPGSGVVEVFDPADPAAGGKQAREVSFTADPPGPFSFLFSRFHFRCHVWCGPLHAFEHGKLVIGPNTLLFAALGLLLGIAVLGLLRVRRGGGPPIVRSARSGVDLFQRFPRLKALVRRRGFQFFFVGVASVVLYSVILTTLFGTQMAGRNLGVMLLWVVWLFLLAVIFTPLGGRIWCLACPLPLIGETLQRGTLTGVRVETGPGDRPTNSLFRGLGRKWPRALDNAWLRTFSFLSLGTFSVALIADPSTTGWVLIGMVALSAVLALIYEHRAFCRYLCPINSFVGLYAMSGKLALRARDLDTCADCKVKTCLKGSIKGWACPYGLCAEDIEEDTDCGLCTECVKTCAYDNIGIFARPGANESEIRTVSEAWMAMVMLVLALAYCAVYLGPWPEVRDWVNILDKGNWGSFAAWSAALWVAALAAVPALVFLTALLGKSLAGSKEGAGRLFIRQCGALVPTGLSVWIAFVVPMLLVNVTFVVQSASDPFGWGWDFFGTAGTPWRQVLPRWIPWFQAAAVLLGVRYGLGRAWRTWRWTVTDDRAALRGMAPLALLLLSLGWALIVFFTD